MIERLNSRITAALPKHDPHRLAACEASVYSDPGPNHLITIITTSLADMFGKFCTVNSKSPLKEPLYFGLIY